MVTAAGLTDEGESLELVVTTLHGAHCHAAGHCDDGQHSVVAVQEQRIYVSLLHLDQAEVLDGRCAEIVAAAAVLPLRSQRTHCYCTVVVLVNDSYLSRAISEESEDGSFSEGLTGSWKNHLSDGYRVQQRGYQLWSGVRCSDDARWIDLLDH